MSLTPLPQATLDQLAHGEGLLVLGPGFGPPELSLDALLARLAEVAPQLEDAALDLSGLEGLSRAERLEISAQALGRARLSAALAALLPTEAALRARLEPHHAALLGLPFSVILDVNLHALARAALYALPWPPRPISEVESGLGPPGPRLVRPRGDLFTEIGALTRREESAWVADHAALVATLRRAALRGCVFYGFEPRDPALRWIYEELLEAPAGIVLAARCEGLWRASWATRGLRFFSGPLDALAAQLIEGVAQHRPPPDLIARLALGADALRDEVAAALATLPEAQLGQSAEQARRALSLYLGLARRRLPLPTAPLAALAARCARLGARREAEAAVGLARQAALAGAPMDAEAEAALAEALARLDDPRAPYALERALAQVTAPAARVELLAWRAKGALARAEALAAHPHAAMEHVADFLARFGADLPLGAQTPDEDEARRSLYYFNLRFGALMALAARLAARRGAVYLRQARRLLERAARLRETPQVKAALAALDGEP